MYLYIHARTHTYKYIYIYMCIYIYMYTFVDVCVYTHTHIYIYIYISATVPRGTKWNTCSALSIPQVCPWLVLEGLGPQFPNLHKSLAYNCFHWMLYQFCIRQNGVQRNPKPSKGVIHGTSFSVVLQLQVEMWKLWFGLHGTCFATLYAQYLVNSASRNNVSYYLFPIWLQGKDPWRTHEPGENVKTPVSF